MSSICLSRVCFTAKEIEREGEREKERENFTNYKIAILISRVMFYINFM